MFTHERTLFQGRHLSPGESVRPMKILFIWTDIETNFPPTDIHIGIAYLSAALKEAGHETELLKVTRPQDKNEFFALIDRIAPDVLGFSAMTNQYDYCARLAAWVKEKYRLPVIFGGHHPTLAPDEVISNPAVDIICLGESEETLVKLVGHMQAGEDYSGVSGTWLKKDRRVIKNDIRPLNENLDDLPVMDLDVFRLDELFPDKPSRTYAMTGRGCPYKCTYCCNPAITRFYGGRGRIVRRKSVEGALGEMKTLMAKHPRLAYIGFQDETFTLNKKWVLEFCGRYRSEVGIPFSAMVRADTLSDEIVRAMSEAGCDLMRIGVESGSEWLRFNVLKRHMTNQQIIDGFDLAQRYGIRTGAFAMMGLPHETPEMVEETITLLKKCNLNHLQLSIFYPLPGTELYEECVREGWLTGEKSTSYFEKPVLTLPTITREQIMHYYRSYYEDFLAGAASKETLGIYDFLVHLGDAEVVTPDLNFVKISMFVEEHPRRFVIQAHPPSRITYRDVAIPPEVVLDFDISMPPYTYEKEGGEVRFLVKVNRKTVFERTLDPKRREEDRGWHDCRVDLGKYGGKKTDISFITAARDNRHCNAGWGRPVLLAKCEKAVFYAPMG